MGAASGCQFVRFPTGRSRSQVAPCWPGPFCFPTRPSSHNGLSQTIRDHLKGSQGFPQPSSMTPFHSQKRPPSSWWRPLKYQGPRSPDWRQAGALLLSPKLARRWVAQVFLARIEPQRWKNSRCSFDRSICPEWTVPYLPKRLRSVLAFRVRLTCLCPSVATWGHGILWSGCRGPFSPPGPTKWEAPGGPLKWRKPRLEDGTNSRNSLGGSIADNAYCRVTGCLRLAQGSYSIRTGTSRNSPQVSQGPPTLKRWKHGAPSPLNFLMPWKA